MFQVRDATGAIIEIASVEVNGEHRQVAELADEDIPVAADLSDSQLSVAGAPVELADYAPVGAEQAMISVRDQAVLFWDDGKTPTPAEGHEIPAGSFFRVKNVATFSMISKTGTATVAISWYAEPQ